MRLDASCALGSGGDDQSLRHHRPIIIKRKVKNKLKMKLLFDTFTVDIILQVFFYFVE
jgi:hypothetical protein